MNARQLNRDKTSSAVALARRPAGRRGACVSLAACGPADSGLRGTAVPLKATASSEAQATVAAVAAIDESPERDGAVTQRTLPKPSNERPAKPYAIGFDELSAGDTSLTLRWTVDRDTRGRPLTRFQVMHRQVPGSWPRETQAAKVNASLRKRTFRGLSPGITYRMRIRACKQRRHRARTGPSRRGIKGCHTRRRSMMRQPRRERPHLKTGETLRRKQLSPGDLTSGG